MPAGQAPTDQLDTTDFDNPVAVGYRHAGSFGIEYYHPVSCICVNRHRLTTFKHAPNLTTSHESDLNYQ
jgi:hypothetical protein